MSSVQPIAAPDSPEQPSRLLLAGLAFDLVGPVVLAQAADGFLEYQPHTRYKGFGRDRLNPYGLGPFCKFKVVGLPTGPGLYVFAIESAPVYVGKTEDFRGRMGPVNYGSISPVNCYGKGQSTNCKINSGVLQGRQGRAARRRVRPSDEQIGVGRSRHRRRSSTLERPAGVGDQPTCGVSPQPRQA
jgi:hypothetical protein